MKKEIEIILSKFGFHKTDLTVGCSVILGCSVWQLYDQNIYITDYDFNRHIFDDINQFNLNNEGILLMFTMSKIKFLYIGQERIMTGEIQEIFNEFIKYLS